MRVQLTREIGNRLYVLSRRDTLVQDMSLGSKSEQLKQEQFVQTWRLVTLLQLEANRMLHNWSLGNLNC